MKLQCSEMAGRVIDKAVQIHGGRGYMREYAVERLYRELRVDRIWEGTSEIQRVVIGNELRKRGPDAFTVDGWSNDHGIDQCIDGQCIPSAVTMIGFTSRAWM